MTALQSESVVGNRKADPEPTTTPGGTGTGTGTGGEIQT